jgi:hypothetical protein
MPTAPISPLRLRFDQARRPAAWLAAVALVVQCALGSALALGMWGETLDPLRLARGICLDPSSGVKGPAGQDQAPVGSAHDHDHCLLCNAGFLAAALPALALLPVPAGAASPLVPAAQGATVGKPSSRHQPRGPPGLA